MHAAMFAYGAAGEPSRFKKLYTSQFKKLEKIYVVENVTTKLRKSGNV